MTVPRIPRHLHRARAALICATLTCLTAAGCGAGSAGRPTPANGGASAVADSSRAPAAPLCGGGTRPTRLAVSRVQPVPRDGGRFGFPAAVAVTDPARVAAVAAAVCGLPHVARRVLLCAGGPLVSYRLSFSAPGLRVRKIHATPANCQLLTGAGPSRLALPRFWRVLGSAMRIAHPGQAAFRGTPGPGAAAGPAPTSTAS